MLLLLLTPQMVEIPSINLRKWSEMNQFHAEIGHNWKPTAEISSGMTRMRAARLTNRAETRSEWTANDPSWIMTVSPGNNNNNKTTTQAKWKYWKCITGRRETGEWSRTTKLGSIAWKSAWNGEIADLNRTREKPKQQRQQGQQQQRHRQHRQYQIETKAKEKLRIGIDLINNGANRPQMVRNELEGE